MWIRKRLYPGVVDGSVLGADGAGASHPIIRSIYLTDYRVGTVIASEKQDDPLIKKRVFLTPSRGWEKDPLAPESKYRLFNINLTKLRLTPLAVLVS